MATTDQDLREHLLATIEAAPELDPENRKELADVFLRELNERYTLVPRGTVQSRPPRERWARGPMWPAFPFWFVIPLLIVLSFALHFPIFLLALVLFFIARAGHFGGWRGRRSMYW